MTTLTELEKLADAATNGLCEPCELRKNIKQLIAMCRQQHEVIRTTDELYRDGYEAIAAFERFDKGEM